MRIVSCSSRASPLSKGLYVETRGTETVPKLPKRLAQKCKTNLSKWPLLQWNILRLSETAHYQLPQLLSKGNQIAP